MFSYLIEVDHDVALRAHAAHHVLQSQGVVDPRRVWHVQVVSFILVPLLHGGHHPVFVRADHMQVLTDRERQVEVTRTVSGTLLLFCSDTNNGFNEKLLQWKGTAKR